MGEKPLGSRAGGRGRSRQSEGTVGYWEVPVPSLSSLSGERRHPGPGAAPVSVGQPPLFPGIDGHWEQPRGVPKRGQRGGLWYRGRGRRERETARGGQDGPGRNPQGRRAALPRTSPDGNAEPAQTEHGRARGSQSSRRCLRGGTRRSARLSPSPGLRGKGQSSAAFSEPARTRSSSIAASVGAVRSARVAAEEWRRGAEGRAGSGAGLGGAGGRGGRAGGGTGPQLGRGSPPASLASQKRREGALAPPSHAWPRPTRGLGLQPQSGPGSPANPPEAARRGSGEPPSGGASARAPLPVGHPRAQISFVPAVRGSPDAARGQRGDSFRAAN